MRISIYRVVLSSDSGKVTLKVVSLSGKKGALKTVLAMENCPPSAIISIVKEEIPRAKK